MRPGGYDACAPMSFVICNCKGEMPGWRTARSATASVNYFNLLACLKNWA